MSTDETSSTCPKCRHAWHGSGTCYNMASDNDCSCPGPVQVTIDTEPIIEMITRPPVAGERPKVDAYFERWAWSLRDRLVQTSASANAAHMEVLLLRSCLELVTEEDDRPLWRRIAAQRFAIRAEVINRHRAERRIKELEAENAALRRGWA